LQEALRVLVVDDEELVRDVVAQMLRNEGHVVHLCATGAEALEYLQHNRTDLLFTDLGMPGMTGVQLIDAVLKQDLLPKERVVALTGLSFESPDVRWLTARKIFVLFKPFNSTSLRWSLATLLTEV
jgi:CheY-like chemotaxis protein